MKGSLAGALMLFVSPAFGAIKSINPLPEGSLPLYNVHTDERLQVNYRDSNGNYNEESLKELNYFLRCHYTQKIITIDIRVIEFLNLVHKNIGGKEEIEVISGYRSPEYNNLLIKEGRGAAKHSLHLQGKAIDIRMPKVELSRIRDIALNLQYGGVGYYPDSGFIHLDSGAVRSW
ncbi:MAG: YcbK family protein [Nitrospiria bacterium]